LAKINTQRFSIVFTIEKFSELLARQTRHGSRLFSRQSGLSSHMQSAQQGPHMTHDHRQDGKHASCLEARESCPHIA